LNLVNILEIYSNAISIKKTFPISFALHFVLLFLYFQMKQLSTKKKQKSKQSLKNKKIKH